MTDDDEDDDIKIQLSKIDIKMNNMLEKLDDIKNIQKDDGVCISKINEKLPVYQLRINNIEDEKYSERINNIEKDIKRIEGSFVVFKYIWYVLTVILSSVITYIGFKYR